MPFEAEEQARIKCLIHAYSFEKPSAWQDFRWHVVLPYCNIASIRVSCPYPVIKTQLYVYICICIKFTACTFHSKSCSEALSCTNTIVPKQDALASLRVKQSALLTHVHASREYQITPDILLSLIILVVKLDEVFRHFKKASPCNVS